jgi:hypothetical protein
VFLSQLQVLCDLVQDTAAAVPEDVPAVLSCRSLDSNRIHCRIENVLSDVFVAIRTAISLAKNKVQVVCVMLPLAVNAE